MFGRVFRFLCAVLFFGLVVGVLLVGLQLMQARGPGPSQVVTRIMIEPGTGTQEVARLLSDQHVVPSSWTFYLAVGVKRAFGDIKAGEYEFPVGASTFAVLDQLVKGEVVQHHLTIPEGLSVAEIIALVNATPGLSGAVDTVPTEGRLLPETYSYTWGTSRQSIINRMVTAMDQLVSPLWEKRLSEFPLKSVNAVLTLASIIEKETGKPDERPVVASVFFNRLQTGMKLQSDPTVIYALTKGEAPLGRALLSKDLEETDSPYNTYMYAGLPPGPIACPGAASIRAVFTPAQTDYFYFVADGTGGHVFASSLKEHNDNVANWRKIQQQKQAGE